MVRGPAELSGLRNIKTMLSSKKRSIPRVQSSAFLDLFILRKEKDRLEKEVYLLEKRKKGIKKRIEEINAEMDKLEKAEAKRRLENPNEFKKPSIKNWKTMSLKY